MEINGNTQLLALIGDPINHSLSPYIHNLFSEKTHKNYVYMAFQVEKGKGKEFLEASKKLPIIGLNVTMPLKEELFVHAHETSMFAKQVGAINTLVLKNGEYIGYNTDGEGFLLSLPQNKKITHNSHVCIIGAGGAAKSIAYAVANCGGKVTFLVRNIEKAKIVVGKKNKLFTYLSLYHDEVGSDVDVLVNASPLGMKNHKDFLDFRFFNRLAPDTLIYDLNYNPWKTNLLCKAKEKGFDTSNGWSMLVCQGALSYELFTGCKIPKEIIFETIAKYPIEGGKSK